MIEQDATHVGVATDHVIESFRNELWPGYKTGEGIEPALLAQFHPLEEALDRDGRRGVAHDRARGRRRAGLRGAHRRAKTSAWRRSASGRPTRTWRSACAATAWCRSTAEGRRSATPKACARSSASSPRLIPDFLALVGDAADGYPGIAGIGAVGGCAAAQPARRDRKLSRQRCWASSASSRCCSRISRRCAPTRRCSAMWTSCAGAAPPRIRRVGRAHGSAAPARARLKLQEAKR